ncbi:ECF transporter S component [Massilibacterium senegalense]|uniref:ECF transporter S component n=1 Tax=Massilibacterium senegalense TaxID=1632858 RepID=UPI000784F1BB|nr:ECF transporter S component [Massilibacterium senegalense]
MNNQSTKLKRLITVSIFSAISYLLMLLDFPFPGFPPFLKIDFSEVPALLITIIFGPIAGISVEAFKNILHYIFQTPPTGIPIDELANFIAGVCFILPTAFIFQKLRTQKGLTIGLILGVILMTLTMSVLNYVAIFPAYAYFMGMELPNNMFQFIATAIAPFNLVKGLIITAVFLLLYGRLKQTIQKQI